MTPTRAAPGDVSAETERVRQVQDAAAANYDRKISFFERILFADGRQWVCSRAQGAVLELAVGTGRNLELYALDCQLTGIELSPKMLAIARQRELDADLRLGDAQALEFESEHFDTVTCTLALCTIPDHAQAVREVHRVLRPGGRFVFMEHVRSPARTVRAVQRLIEPLTIRFEADHLTREPLDAVRACGFEIEELERSKWGIVERACVRKPV